MSTLPLASLNDILPIEQVVWDIKRSDEISGDGDSRVWQAELADPLWTGEILLAEGESADLKRVAAIIRRLNGAQDSFFLCDPLSRYPFADPDGVILGASVVQIASIGLDNRSLALKGLPAAYKLTTGDKGQATFATSRNFFFEVSEDVTANGSGVTPQFDIFPHCPPGLAVNDLVILAKPACRVFIMPGTHNPGTARNTRTSGASFTVMERRR
jgi:hypothetical protein